VIPTPILKVFPKTFINIRERIKRKKGFKANLGSFFIMQTIIVVVIVVSVIIGIFGLIYYSWCKNNIPLQATEFSFDDVYHYEEGRI